MDYTSAIKHLLNGRTITRRCWAGRAFLTAIPPRPPRKWEFALKTFHGVFPWRPHSTHARATDWDVL